MKKLDLITKHRRELARKYQEALEEIEGIKMLHDPDDRSTPKCFSFIGSQS